MSFKQITAATLLFIAHMATVAIPSVGLAVAGALGGIFLLAIALLALYYVGMEFGSLAGAGFLLEAVGLGLAGLKAFGILSSVMLLGIPLAVLLAAIGLVLVIVDVLMSRGK